ETVAYAIRTVFVKFEELGSARQVLVWWNHSGLKFPVRRLQPSTHPVIWTEPSYRMILQTLSHPIYAGVYAFGRTKQTFEVDPLNPVKVRTRRQRVPRDEWRVLIQDHHPAYIAFDRYLQIQDQIRSNTAMNGKDDDFAKGPAREGTALLQGLVRCAICGRPMNVGYGGRRPSNRSASTLQYRCGAKRRD